MSTYDSQKNNGLNRREFIAGAGAMAALAATAKTAFAADEMMHMHHTPNQYQDLIHAAVHCSMQGKICLNHCFDMFKQGNTELAYCAELIEETDALCSAVVTLATLETSHLKELAKVCRAAVSDCETECLKHAKKHDICKTMAEACKECISECDNVIG